MDDMMLFQEDHVVLNMLGKRTLFVNEYPRRVVDYVNKHDKFSKVQMDDFPMYSEDITLIQNTFRRKHFGQIDANVLDEFARRISVTSNGDTHMEAAQHVKGLLEYFLNESQNIEPRLKMKVIESGSFYSNLRVGMPYEFDFMLDISETFGELGDIEGRYDVKKVVKKVKCEPDGYFYEVYPKKESIFNCGKSVQLNMERIKKFMFSLFSRIIRTNDCQRMWKIDKYSTEADVSGPAFQLSLYYKDKAILIDLVPCLRFPESGSLPPFYHSKEGFLKKLIGHMKYQQYLKELPGKLFLVCKSDRADLFRLSTSQIEKDLYLNYLEEKYLQILRITKYYFQTFYTGNTAGNEDSWGHGDVHSYKLKHNKPHPFGNKSYVPSYIITNLFFHYLAIVLHDAEFKRRPPGEIAMLFLGFVYSVLGHRMPKQDEADELEDICMSMGPHQQNKWDHLDINIHGWCFEKTNSIKVRFVDHMHGYFIRSMKAYISILHNISHIHELAQFPLIAPCEGTWCESCFDQTFIKKMKELYQFDFIRFKPCVLHSWKHSRVVKSLEINADEIDTSISLEATGRYMRDLIMKHETSKQMKPSRVVDIDADDLEKACHIWDLNMKGGSNKDSNKSDKSCVIS